MTRLQKLVEYLWKHQNVPFAYGSHDCGTFTAGWVDMELGTDYTGTVQGIIKRQSLRKVLGTVRNPGGYRALVEHLTGQNAIVTDTDWHAGDIAIFMQDERVETLGVTSKRLIHAPGVHGLVSFDASRIICYWRLEWLKH
jgi:hypothetical protein